MNKKSFAGILALILFSCIVVAGDNDKPTVMAECARGKWVISKTRFQWNVSMQNITKVKQSNEQRKKAAEALKDGIITFTDSSTVYFTPAGDTTVYTGKLSSKSYSGWSSDAGGSGSYGSEGNELVVKFFGKGAKYNFAMMYDCPGKRKPNIFDGRSYDKYASFQFTRVEP